MPKTKILFSSCFYIFFEDYKNVHANAQGKDIVKFVDFPIQIL